MQSLTNVCIVFGVMTLSGCAARALEEPEREPMRRASGAGGGPYDYTQNTYGGWGGQSAKGGASALGGSAGRATGGSETGGSSAAGSGAGSSGTSLGAAPSDDCPSLTLARLRNGSCVPRVSEYDVAKKPTSIVLGSDGRIWVDDDDSDELLQLDDSGQVIGRVSCEGGSPRALLGGADDAVVWYTSPQEKTLVEVDRDHRQTATALGFEASALAFGNSGDLFLTEFGKAVYRVRPTQSAPTRWSSSPTDVIVVSPDDHVWFSQGSALGQLLPDGGLNDFLLGDTAYASGLCLGPDSGLWFSDGFAHQLVRVSLDGTLSRILNLPTGTSPGRLIVGPDGALWFTETGTNRLGRVSLDGEITSYPLPTPGGLPHALVVGSDGNIWFTTLASRKVGRLIPDPVP
jgi:virginiamycin B lyase